MKNYYTPEVGNVVKTNVPNSLPESTPVGGGGNEQPSVNMAPRPDTKGVGTTVESKLPGIVKPDIGDFAHFGEHAESLWKYSNSVINQVKIAYAKFEHDFPHDEIPICTPFPSPNEVSDYKEFLKLLHEWKTTALEQIETARVEARNKQTYMEEKLKEPNPPKPTHIDQYTKL